MTSDVQALEGGVVRRGWRSEIRHPKVESNKALHTMSAPVLTQVEFSRDDFDRAEGMARKLGYKQTTYSSTSDLCGLFCLSENPEHSSGPRSSGCVIKTVEFGLCFIQTEEDLGL